ncbi:MAG: DNA polymerase III subunit chi [Candidatus Accumulibacter sp.]|uniref:DNA polymerase III subunit chi n=1 Tax=Accumulibacter sp. TaxID=2053492 RepID=UPI0028796D94|nr:DNA polymerase III subunit chi [Accumulibacter sp.]MDS4014912.1 DNA polymerase III subunit chi [Accumulibacter sp.]
MTQVFFYHNAGDRLSATLELIARACARKKRLLVYAPRAEVAEALDRALWMVPPSGFIPHVQVDSPLAAETPVLIAGRLEQVPFTERLLNLSDDIPPEHDRFVSLIEVVGQRDEERLAGRRRARFYKDHGDEIRYVDLSS